jgi:hypothetical protein
MRRHVAGLNQGNGSGQDAVPDGVFFGRVERFQYRWHPQKPHYLAVFSVLEPRSLAGRRFSGCLYCAPKALWKLNWFLLDFGYDTELLGRNEIDDKLLVGLSGVIKITSTIVHGTSLLTLDGFAPASEWETLSGRIEEKIRGGKAAS